MRRLTLTIFFIVIIFSIVTTIQGKWDTYLFQGASLYFELKEDTEDSSIKVLSEEVEVEVASYIQQPINVSSSVHILGLGDSLTEGFGSTDKDGYIIPLEEYLETNNIDVTISRVTKKGRTSKGLLKEVKEKEVEGLIKDSDLIFMTIGGNDIMKVVKKERFSTTLEQIEEKRDPFKNNLKETIDHIHTINEDSEVVIVGLYNPFLTWVSYVPQPFKALETWNDEYIEIASSNDFVHYIDVEDVFSEDSKDMLYKDYFHPNGDGYRLIANRIKEYISIKEE